MSADSSGSQERRGKCVCGAIQITAKKGANAVGVCHCRTCRRWGGGPFMEIDCGTEVAIKDSGNLSVFSSSDWAERGFCSQCGTHLFYRLKESGQHIVPVGLFDDDENLEFKSQVFVDERPAYYRFANETEELTGAELFAKFGSSA